MSDGREWVRVGDDAKRRILFVCTMSGRRAADVRAEALRIGAEFLELKYKEDSVTEPSGLSMDDTLTRKPNCAERRAAASNARKSPPVKKARGKKVTKRKASTTA